MRYGASYYHLYGLVCTSVFAPYLIHYIHNSGIRIGLHLYFESTYSIMIHLFHIFIPKNVIYLLYVKICYKGHKVEMCMISININLTNITTNQVFCIAMNFKLICLPDFCSVDFYLTDRLTNQNYDRRRDRYTHRHLLCTNLLVTYFRINYLIC